MASYFTDESMLRVVTRERATVLAGGRALLMQAAHPLAVSGLLAHSTSLDEPYDRLARTAQIMSIVGFGEKEDADRVTRMVRAQHHRVRGKIPTAVGPFPAGTPYRADDPDLLLWVLFTLVDSVTVAFELYVRDLDEDEHAALWEDYKVVGRLFGLRTAEMPDTLRDLRAYRRRMLEGDTLVVSDWARTRGREIVLEPPVPIVARPLVQAFNFVTIALLPDPIREQYRFEETVPPFVRKLITLGGAEYVKRAVIPFLPDRLRYAPSAAQAAAA